MKYEYFVVEGFSHGTVYSNTKFITVGPKSEEGISIKE
jgi:hypothetical protein